MEEYFNSHSSDFKYAALVVGVVCVLILITSLMSKLFLKRKRERWSSDLTPSLNMATRLLNILWIVLGLMAISFIFVAEGQYGLLNDYFKSLLYLGVLTVLTSVVAAILNMWFKHVIRRMRLTHEDPTNYKFLRYEAEGIEIPYPYRTLVIKRDAEDNIDNNSKLKII